MNILILGTSNSLLNKGWVSGLKKAIPDVKLYNYSVGASPGIQFGCVINIDFSQYDYVFFDSVPNDQEYFHYYGQTQDLEGSQQILYEILATIASQARLIILGIPHIQLINKYEEIYAEREELSKAVGAQFVDFKSILAHISGFIDADIGLVYESPTHPVSFMMNLLGEYIGQFITSRNDVFFEKTNKNYRHNFTVCHFGETNSPVGKIENKKNSLMSENFLILESNDELIVTTEHICLGFYINKHWTNAHAELSTDTETIFLNLATETNEHKLLKMFVPLKTGTVLKRIKLSSIHNETSTSPTLFNNNKNKIESPVLSVAQMLFWKDSEIEWRRSAEKNRQDHREITEYLKLKLTKKILEQPTPQYARSILKTYFNSVIMYDIEWNRCVIADPMLLSIYPDTLIPVSLRFVGYTQVELTVTIRNIEHTISAYEDGLFIDNVLIKSPSNKRLGNQLKLETHSDGKVSLQCNGLYLRASRLFTHGGLFFDRKIIGRHESFTLD